MKYTEVSERERVQAGALAEMAILGARGVVTAVLVATARLAVAAVADADPVSATRRLRSDGALLRAIDGATKLAVNQAFSEITDAIVAGYADDGNWRGAALMAQAKGVKVTVSVDHEDQARLRAYPIQGHTPAEVAEYLSRQLRYGIDGALSTPLSKRSDAEAVPAALGEVAQMHAERIGNAVREAYFAGVQAATKELGSALTGG